MNFAINNTGPEANFCLRQGIYMQIKNNNGFTFIELVIIVVVIGIMAAISAPVFLSWKPDMRLKAATRDLYGAVMKAKGAAVKRNMNCALTFNQNVPTTGTTTYAYIVYVDTDTDFQYDDGEDIIVQVQQWPKDVSLDITKGGGDGLTFTNDNAGKPAIAFQPTAIPTASGGGFANGSAFLKNTNGRESSVVISQAGNISIN